MSRYRSEAPPTIGDIEIRLAAAVARHQHGDLEKAAALYRSILRDSPGCFDALHLLGVITADRGGLDQGIALIKRALAIDPSQPDAIFSLSKALLQKGDGLGAMTFLAQLVKLQPQNADALFLHGHALQLAGQYEGCVESYERALKLQPRVPMGWNNLAAALRMLRRTEYSLDCSNRALKLHEKYAKAFNNRGLALLDLRRTSEAIQSFDRALAIESNFPEALHNRGTALMLENRFVEARDAFAQLAQLAPDFSCVRGNLLHAKLSCCDWSNYEDDIDHVSRAVERGQSADAPFSFICVSSSAAAHRRCAETYTQLLYPVPVARVHPANAYGHERIRVAYLSGDFGDHAVSYLLAGIFEHHDATQFETVAVSWGRTTRGSMRTRLEAAFARFIDVTSWSDADVVRHLVELEVDIAVDLTGHTRGSRMGIFAQRPAPVQVNFLGLPATTGSGYIDYLIADEFLIPEELREHYTEQIVRLPGSFQPNDDSRALPRGKTTRRQFGLPDTGVVFCSFNSNFKLNPTCFDIWARLLKRTRGSVLWLLGARSIAEENLRKEAALRGVDADRLIFAERVPYSEHLARYEHADLFLDSLPFNAGATASDALSMGVPLLTCIGDSFASRMAGSLLSDLGFPELITSSLAEYEAAALALASSPTRLAEIRHQLIERRTWHRFFDTKSYCRSLESAYQIMWARSRAGLPATAISVPSCAAGEGRHG